MGSTASSTRLGRGAVAGAAAFVLGYLVTYLTQSQGVEERLRGINFIADLLGGDPIPVWQGVGWLFYNAHFVRTRVPSLGGQRTENFIATADGGSMTFLYLVPVVALFAAGVAIAMLSSVDSFAEYAMDGAAVVVGYLPLALAGIFLFSYSVGDGAIEPDPITAILLAGVVYPLVLGAAGAVAGGYVSEHR